VDATVRALDKALQPTPESVSAARFQSGVAELGR